MEAWIRNIGLKGFFGVAAAAVLLWAALPALLHMAMNVVFFAFLVGLLATMAIFAPAIGELFSQLAQWLWDSAIRNGPIHRLERDLEAFGEDIKAFRKKIVEAISAVEKSHQVLAVNKSLYDADEYKDQLSSVKQLEVGISQMEVERFAMQDRYARFEKVIAKAKADLAIGKALSGAANILSFGKKDGISSRGSQIALDQVSKELAEGRAGMRVALTKVPSEYNVAAKPALENKSPVNLDFSKERVLEVINSERK